MVNQLDKKKYWIEFSVTEINIFMQRKHVFRLITRLFANISKSGNIWGGNFYRSWTVKLTLPALVHAQFMSFTVQIR